ncbi:DUF4276 family protein [Amycolatopsis silviterrae]|uniref:DUF4276 family protein n=1 Tax=Amycolatopsis silviterrae TaxID=1656914 RepID=A0ABW5HFR5_9PSEU
MTGEYRRMHLLLEGQTEENVVTMVLQPYLESLGWTVAKSVVITKRMANGAAYRGGVSSWAKLADKISKHLNDSSLHVLTTLFDYYGFPSDAPGMDSRPRGSAWHQVEHVEEALATAIGDPRFIPNLILHETETWVFAAADQLGELLGSDSLAGRLRNDVKTAGDVELVNDSPETRPSRRLEKYFERYSKTTDGPLAIDELGIEALRAQCSHLDRWLGCLEQHPVNAEKPAS